MIDFSNDLYLYIRKIKRIFLKSGPNTVLHHNLFLKTKKCAPICMNHSSSKYCDSFCHIDLCNDLDIYIRKVKVIFLRSGP